MKIALFVFLIFLPALSSACSCAPFSILNAVTKSEAVFIATVTKTEILTQKDVDFKLEFYDRIQKAEYKINHLIKGPADRKGYVFTTDPDQPSCSVRFVKGERYIIYLKENKFVTYCGGTKHMSRILDEERRMVGDKPF